jgi:hypothetical protein
MKTKHQNFYFKVSRNVINRGRFLRKCSNEAKLIYFYLFGEADASGFFEFDALEMNEVLNSDTEKTLLYISELVENFFLEYDPITERGFIVDWIEHKFGSDISLNQKGTKVFFERALANKLYCDKHTSRFSLYPSGKTNFKLVKEGDRFSLIEIEIKGGQK